MFLIKINQTYTHNFPLELIQSNCKYIKHITITITIIYNIKLANNKYESQTQISPQDH